jgi:hypothetical protein
MEHVGILVYFTAIWYILWPFGIFDGYLDYLATKAFANTFYGVHVIDGYLVFSPFWYAVARTIWQPCSTRPNCAITDTAAKKSKWALRFAPNSSSWVRCRK